MKTDLIHKLVIIVGAVISFMVFAVKLMRGTDLVHAAWESACIMFAISLILLVALQSIAQVLFKHLAEQQREALEREQSEAIDVESDSSDNDNPKSANGEQK